MKIIIANYSVLPFHPPGGIEKYVLYFSRALRQEGAEVEVVASTPPGGEQDAELDGVRYTFLAPSTEWDRPFAWGPSLRNLLFSLNLARYLRRRHFDILHAYNTTPYPYLRLRRHAPVVHQPFEEVMNYGLAAEEHLSLTKHLSVRAKRHMDRYILTHADAVACENQGQQDDFARIFGVVPDRMFILPVGVDIATVDAVLKTQRLSRKELGIAEKDFVLVSVNRLFPLKGVNYLVEAFAEVVREIPCARLVLVGTGPEEDAIKTQIRQLGLEEEIRHLKCIPEDRLYALYALADVYVSPTLHISSSQSVIEAMACGLPVVSSGQEFWVQNGVNGYVVPQRDPLALAHAVVKTYDNDRRRSFAMMSRQAAQEYDSRAIATRALERYQQLLSHRG